MNEVFIYKIIADVLFHFPLELWFILHLINSVICLDASQVPISVALGFRLETLTFSPLVTMRLAALFRRKIFSMKLSSQCYSFIKDTVFRIKRDTRFVSSYVVFLEAILEQPKSKTDEISNIVPKRGT